MCQTSVCLHHADVHSTLEVSRQYTI